MEILFKVGSSRYPTDKLFEMCPRDGHILAVEDDKHKWGYSELCHHLVIRVKDDYKTAISTSDSIIAKSDVNELERYVSFYNTTDSYKWDVAEFERDFYRKYFLDFKKLLNDKLITLSQYETIYNRDKDTGIITLDKTLSQIMQDEQLAVRLDEKKNMALASGTGYIGPGDSDSDPGYAGYYSTLNGALGDIDASGLTGNLTFEHDDESTTVSADHAVTEDLDGNTLTIKPQSGDEHGGKYGNATHSSGDGARSIATSKYREHISTQGMDDAVDGAIVLQDMVFSGYGKYAYIYHGDGIDWTVQRNVMMSSDSADDYNTIYHLYNNSNINIFNNIIYDSAAPAIDFTLDSDVTSSGKVVNVFNNTIINCSLGIGVANDRAATFNIKNNLCQENTADYTDTADFDSNAYNISKDTTSPDGATYQLTLNTDNFENYTTGAGADFQLVSGTNVSILGAAVDPGTMPDEDIVGNVRSTWYIGASEIVGAGPSGLEMEIAMHHYTKNILSGR